MSKTQITMTDWLEAERKARLDKYDRPKNSKTITEYSIEKHIGRATAYNRLERMVFMGVLDKKMCNVLGETGIGTRAIVYFPVKRKKGNKKQ